MSKINTLIIDADAIWRNFIESLFAKEQDIRVIGSVATGQEALHHVLEADIVVIDINLSENLSEGLEFVSDIFNTKRVPIIILTAISDPNIILKAFQAGAIHYLDKLKYNIFPDAIREVIYSRSPFQILLEDYQNLRRNMKFHALTPAEKDIIDLILKGYTLSNISSTLYKAESTVKNQVGNIYKKMNVKNRKQLISILQ